MAMKHMEDQGGGLEGSIPGLVAERISVLEQLNEWLKQHLVVDHIRQAMGDENLPLYQKAIQFGQHLVGDQLSPISVAGANRALQLSGKLQLQLGMNDIAHPVEAVKRLAGQANDRDVSDADARLWSGTGLCVQV
jgi:hypothetical protein